MWIRFHNSRNTFGTADICGTELFVMDYLTDGKLRFDFGVVQLSVRYEPNENPVHSETTAEIEVFFDHVPCDQLLKQEERNRNLGTKREGIATDVSVKRFLEYFASLAELAKTATVENSPFDDARFGMPD